MPHPDRHDPARAPTLGVVSWSPDFKSGPLERMAEHLSTEVTMKELRNPLHAKRCFDSCEEPGNRQTSTPEEVTCRWCRGWMIGRGLLIGAKKAKVS